MLWRRTKTFVVDENC